jgi:transposase
MDAHACLPDPEFLSLQHTRQSPTVIVFDISSRASHSACPRCCHLSARIHSRYTRTLKDLPLLGKRVRWHLTVRKFFCDLPSCPQRIFCERLPSVTHSWRRDTVRLEHQHRQVAYESGAESGARILHAFGCPISADSLLSRLRRSPPASAAVVRQLGIDDWAWRKGQRYGTILVDLERHQVIDLLADRDVSTLTVWLSGHPEIELITRDRAGAYQEAATLGAPQAQQIADRWHLLKNVRETLERFLQRLHPKIKALSQTLRRPEPLPVALVAQAVPSERPAKDPLSPPTLRQQARFDAVKQRLQAGVSVKRAAQELGVAQGTVRKYRHLEAHPGNAQRWPRPRDLTPFEPWLTLQWEAGCQNAVVLHQAVRQQGFRGGYTVVRAFCQQLRGAGTLGVPAPRRGGCPSVKTLSWAMLANDVDQPPELSTLLEHCRAQHGEFVIVESLLKAGWAMFRKQAVMPLRIWLTALGDSGVQELQGFAVGIDRDFEAIQGALESPHSNGQVEGQVNRLKTIKRGMYGRAGLDLLRARVRYRSGSSGTAFTKI